MLVTRRPFPLLLLTMGLLWYQTVCSQQINLSLREVLQRVENNLPQLEAYRQQGLAAQENIRLAKNGLMPSLNAGYQLNVATYNNITGMSYPGLLMPISGPPSQTNDLNFVPGSALGALFTWNPFTFGQRNAAIEKATARFKEVNALYNEQLFRYQYSALNTYLEAVYVQQVMQSIRAGIVRNSTGQEQALVLAASGLKPGIDTTQFQAAIVQAEMDLLQAEKTFLQKLTDLSVLTGLSPAAISTVVLTDTVFNKMPATIMDTVDLSTHPLYQSMAARRQTAQAELKEIQKLWVPQLDIWGNVYTRGSGIDANGQVNKTDGFRFSRTNAGLGLQLIFPLLQYSKVNIRKKQQGLLLKAAEADLQQAALTVDRQSAGALLQYQLDNKIAEKAPLLLKAATDVYDGLRISYEAGLVDYARLSQALYDLVKAELSQAGVQLQAARSLLALAVARGNLNLFLSSLK